MVTGIHGSKSVHLKFSSTESGTPKGFNFFERQSHTVSVYTLEKKKYLIEMFGLYVRAFVHACHCHMHHSAHACTNVLTLMDEQVLAHNSYNMLSTFKSPTKSLT